MIGNKLRCFDENRLEDAFFLAEMASAYIRFDIRRLTDQNRAGIIWNKLYKERTSKQDYLYMEAYGRVNLDLEGGFPTLRSMCERAKRIGMPTYYPHYMMIPLPPADPQKKEIPLAPLEKVRVLDDAEMRLLYGISYQSMWAGKKPRDFASLPFCGELESKLNNLKRMNLMR